MKRILFLMAMCLAMSAAMSQVMVFNGTDTIGNGRTLTSSTITISDVTPVQIWPVLQVYTDYKSGTGNIYYVGWYSLDNVRWDTIPGFYYAFTGTADLTEIVNTTTWESPVLVKYVKFTARGHTGTQSCTPKGYFAYKKVP